MTAINVRKLKLNAHKKQYLNSLNDVNALISKLTNDKLDNFSSVYMQNAPNALNSVDCNSLMKSTLEEDQDREKRMKILKKNFTYQKCNFSITIAKKTHAKKVLHHLSTEDLNGIEVFN